MLCMDDYTFTIACIRSAKKLQKIHNSQATKNPLVRGFFYQTYFKRLEPLG